MHQVCKPPPLSLPAAPLPRAEPHLIARVLRQDVQRADRQPELAAVRELAYARSQVHQLVPGYLRQAAQL